MTPNSTLPPEELLGDPVYPFLKQYVIESTGLAYYADKDADLARRIGRRLSNLVVRDCSSYLDLLRHPQCGSSELDALIVEITIGETYFFRHREHFEALRDLVLPDLIARNPENRRLRIWCAGCADGAEPYSLSILLRRELAHLLAGWDVSIIGTDINRQCLDIAREGGFEEWSLRATSEDLRQACFLKEGKRWKIAPKYKEGVSFQFHNLVEDSSLLRLNNLSAFDLIVCRNVMIYFGAELMEKIIRRFHDSLVPAAWLLVGPSEPNMTCFRSFRAVNAPGVTLYQKEDRPRSNMVDVVALPMELPPPRALVYPREYTAPAPVESVAMNVAECEIVLPTLAEMRQHADRGDWERAAQYCEKLLVVDKLDVQVHFHYALILEQMGKHAQSEEHFRRAIFLNRGCPLVHYHLGLLLRSRGDGRQALRCFDNARQLITARSDTEILSDADGITVADLRKLTQMQITTLSEHT